MNEREKLNDELRAIEEKVLEQTEGALEERYNILCNTEQNLLNYHSDQIRNVGIISGVVAPLSLTLLQIEDLQVNVFLLLLGFSILIANIALSQIILHRELTKRNKSVTEASVSLNFALTSRNDLRNKSGSISFLLDNLRKIDRELGISANNIELLMSKIRFRKYDKIVVYIFVSGCILLVLSLLIHPVFNFAQHLIH